jgi:hypothetical protein
MRSRPFPLRLARLGLVLALLFSGLAAAGAVPAAEAALLVPVEEGIHRVQVEVWDASTARWEIFSVAHLNGEAGTVKVRVPAGVPRSQLRVRATSRALVPVDWIDRETTVESGLVVETEANATGRLGGASFTTESLDSVPPSGEEAVVESDIWKVLDDTLYYYNQRRGLQVFDLAEPKAPRLLGSLRFPARGEQMYVLDEGHVLLLAEDHAGTGIELVRVGEEGTPSIARSFPALEGS